MPEKKNYQNKSKTTENLQACINRLVQSGIRELPSERELCQTTGGARKVIRCLLAEMEQDGRIIRENSRRLIANYKMRSEAIPLLYVAGGTFSVINASWARLWQELCRQAPEHGVKPELLLMNIHDTTRQLVRKIQKSPAQYVVITDIASLVKTVPAELAEKTCIFTDEQAVPNHVNVICLDNLEAGRVAARALYNAGCRRPALYEERHHPDYLPFRLRAQGFVEECARLGLPLGETDRYICKMSTVHLKRNILSVIDASDRIAAANRYDSVFCVTDDQVRLIRSVLFDHGITHEDLQIVSVDGANECEHSAVPFASVDTGAKPLATAILQAVCAKASVPDSEIGHIRVATGMRYEEVLRTPHAKTKKIKSVK